MIVDNKFIKALAALGMLGGIILLATSLNDSPYMIAWYIVIIIICGIALFKKPYNIDDDERLK